MWNRKLAESPAPGALAGFTLLEVVVALAIVAIALVPLLRLHLLSLDATVRAQDLTTAVLLAQGHMAAMGAFPDTGEAEGAFEDPELSKFRWQTAVTAYTLGLGPGSSPGSSSGTSPGGTGSGESGTQSTSVEVRRIEVTVRWLDGQGERFYTLEAYASQ
jgi:type II secretion system protein I